MNRRHFLAAPLVLAAGCVKRESRLVVYCAQDRGFAEGLLADFTRETGLAVEPKYDTEANKSVSLAVELEKEAARPRCDVHWNNEILGTIRLARKGVYQPHDAPNAKPFPDWTKPPDRTWQAFAARARVLIVNTNIVKGPPRGLLDLIEPKWKSAVAMAKPFFGTTATQAACLFDAMGADSAKTFYRNLKSNGVSLVAGNTQVAVDVAAGRFAVGTTDTDDALIEIQAGKPVAMIQTDDKLGTLFIPNTLAVVKNGLNPDAAEKLVEFLLRAETEKRLAEGGGFQIPLNPTATARLPAGLLTPAQAKPMVVDFDRAADHWDDAQRFLRDTYGA
ncbi:MAG TPA: extracellular solute-binding protein [Gemmataceae bacterium]|nr:extracellular solute-binding protein [Gemmataceae bacterium]